MRHYKFSHKKMPVFKVDFTIRKSVEGGNIANSTIPIQFENVLMYVNPNFRGKISKRLKVLMREFKQSMGTDEFWQRCPSMNEIVDFLDFYHEKVIKTVLLVDNYFTIIVENEAITEYNGEQ